MNKKFLIENITNRVMENIYNKLLCEKRGLQSQKLYDIMNKYGKPIASDVDLNNVTDEDILYFTTQSWNKQIKQELGKKYNTHQFIYGNDYIIAVRYDKNKDLQYNDKIADRMKEQNRTDGSRNYRWHNKEAQDYIFNNPYFKEWPKGQQRKALNNVKNNKPLHADF